MVDVARTRSGLLCKAGAATMRRYKMVSAK
jgi:hypothetical protein